jgi:hypothetical protein
MEFNFEGVNYYSLCGLTDEVGHDLAVRISIICEEIDNNIDDYVYHGSGNDDGKYGIHKGKVLKKFFEHFADEQEKVVLYFTFDHIMNKLVSVYKRKIFFDSLSQIIEAVEKEEQGTVEGSEQI